jgi:hypothetical protein
LLVLLSFVFVRLPRIFFISFSCISWFGKFLQLFGSAPSTRHSDAETAGRFLFQTMGR